MFLCQRPSTYSSVSVPMYFYSIKKNPLLLNSVINIPSTPCSNLQSHFSVVSSYKESRKYGYMLPNLSPSPNLYKVQSVYNNNVAS